MPSDVLARFSTLCAIPHCSFDTEAMRAHLVQEAKACGASVCVDKAGNILAQKGSPKVCLQAHYDMVCMGSAPRILLQEEAGYLCAKDSSLGADNGMGVAMMLSLLHTQDHLECLFTNDEEVGLLGANGLEMQIQSPCLLNLDSEEEGKVFVGCAGGVDIIGTCSPEFTKAPVGWALYEICVSGLRGGHSGIQIHENIPNAIALLVHALAEQECALVHLEGGERINSIPTAARAVVMMPKPFTCKEPFFTCKALAQRCEKVVANSDTILKTLCAFSQGVRGWDAALSLPSQSINLSLLSFSEDSLRVEFFARAMNTEGLDALKKETKALLELGGFSVAFKDETLPWNPNIGPFALLVKEEATAVWGKAEFAGIHAGLECGVLLSKHDAPLEVCSLGPKIEAPHTVKERCEVASVHRVVEIVERIVTRKTYGTD